MKKTVAFITLILILNSGCSTFREIFNEEPRKEVKKTEEMQLPKNSPGAKLAEQQKSAKKAPDWFVSTNKKNSRPLAIKSELSDAEAQLLDKEMSKNDGLDSTRSVMHQRYEKSRKEGEAFVFGDSWGKWFGN